LLDPGRGLLVVALDRPVDTGRLGWLLRLGRVLLELRRVRVRLPAREGLQRAVLADDEALADERVVLLRLPVRIACASACCCFAASTFAACRVDRSPVINCSSADDVNVPRSRCSAFNWSTSEARLSP
jgi:hypothetical protein